MKAKLLGIKFETTKAEMERIIAKLLDLSTDNLVVLLNDPELKDSFKQVVVYLKQVESEPERVEKINFLLSGNMFSPLWVELSNLDDIDVMIAMIPIMTDLLVSDDEESAEIAHINLRARGDGIDFYSEETAAYKQLLLDYEKEH